MQAMLKLYERQKDSSNAEPEQKKSFALHKEIILKASLLA